MSDSSVLYFIICSQKSRFYKNNFMEIDEELLDLIISSQLNSIYNPQNIQIINNKLTHLMKNKSISQARISQQIKNMRKEKLVYLAAQPLESDIFTWHFTIQGPENTDFHQGLYHGEIFLPFQYPFKPPDMVFMNPNGRFQINTKICLTITQYHPQQWNSAWTIRTMLEAVQGIGYVPANSETRKYLAKQSHNFACSKCGILKDILKPRQPQQQVKQKVAEQQNIFPVIIQQREYEQIKRVQRKDIKLQQQISYKIHDMKFKNMQQGNDFLKKIKQYDFQSMKNKLYGDCKKKIEQEKQYKYDKKGRNTLLLELQRAKNQYQMALSSVKWLQQ